MQNTNEELLKKNDHIFHVKVHSWTKFCKENKTVFC